jgi:hypothetical protein
MPQRARRIAVGLLAVTLLALAAPSPALAERCSGGYIGDAYLASATRDRALSSVAVRPGRSIGPIRVGMTRRQISRVARPVRLRARGGFLQAFRFNGLNVYVGWGYWGTARTLFAASGKLVVAGVSLSDGPERMSKAIPQLQLSRCWALDPNSSWEAYLPEADFSASTKFGWYPTPEIPRLAITGPQRRR